MIQDIRFGLRMMRKNLGVTLVAILATAIGISANTTIFSTVHSLILQPFNFANQERLIVVWEHNPHADILRGSVAPGNFLDWRQQSRTCEQLVAIEQHYFDFTDGETPERFAGSQVTAGFFDVLGVKAAYGRTFLPEESEPGHEPVALLKYEFWQHRFAGDPDIVGQRLAINGQRFMVVGVMPADFDYPYHGGQLWTPLVFDQKAQNNRSGHSLEVMGLLKPETDIAQAQADLAEISQRAEAEFPETNSGRKARVVSLTDDAVRGTAIAMPTLIGAAVFVLLIACANVANLLLARATSRQKEIAVRLALGISRWRLVRQLLTESVLLSLAGGALGFLLSIWAVKALAQGIPEDFAKFIPGWNHFGINQSVFLFTLAASVLTGILFGLAPAWQALSTNVNEALAGSSKGASGTDKRHRLRGALVVTEIVLSLVLMISAGLLIRSFAEMLRADLGLRPENVLALEVALPNEGYKEESQRHDFYTQLLRRLESLPDVTDVGAINIVPISGAGNNSKTLQIVGAPPFPLDREPLVEHRVATPNYFNAIGTALRKGRLFTEQDNAQALPVVLINETVAKRFFPTREPIGERLKFGASDRETVEIIGIVADVKNDDLEERADPTVYIPFAQQPRPTMNLIIHAHQEPTRLAAAVRSEVRALDRNLPVSQIKTLNRMIDERRSSKRLMTVMLAIFAAAALALAAVGIYAVMFYATTQRTHEIGIRLALGAQRRDILKLVIGQGLKLTLIGVSLGLVCALAATRAMSFFLYGVTATDPLTFIGVALLFAVVALAACWLPARRATQIDPLTALRHD